MKLSLTLVRLDANGYESNGRYWGIGFPLYEYLSDDCSVNGHVRGNDRKHAKELVKSLVPNCTFY